MAKKKLFHVLVINHRHGTDAFVFSNGARARAYLYKYVRRWWDSDGPGCKSQAMPKSRSEAIEKYFEFAADKVESEWYRIDASTMDPEYA